MMSKHNQKTKQPKTYDFDRASRYIFFPPKLLPDVYNLYPHSSVQDSCTCVSVFLCLQLHTISNMQSISPTWCTHHLQLFSELSEPHQLKNKDSFHVICLQLLIYILIYVIQNEIRRKFLQQEKLWNKVQIQGDTPPALERQNLFEQVISMKIQRFRIN